MFEMPTPHDMFIHHAETYDTPYQAPGNSGMFRPDRAANGFSHHQGLVTPDSSTHHRDQYDGMAYAAAAADGVGEAFWSPRYQDHSVREHEAHSEAWRSEQPMMDKQEEVTTEAPVDWRALVDFDIPSSTQAHIATIPQIKALYDAYLASYKDEDTPNATHMVYAKALAFAFLTHYYPASEGYTVEPASPGPIAKHGMSFILAADDKSDVWKDLRTKKTTHKAARRGGHTLMQFEIAEAQAKTDAYNHGLSYMLGLQWDCIQPEDIAAFVVERKFEITDKITGILTYHTRPHTYLAIMIDNFGHPPRFSKANLTHRSDLLSDALCRRQVQEGYGVLLYGPRLEFYGYDAGPPWVCADDAASKVLGFHTAEEEDTQHIEPRTEMLRMGGTALEVDMRTTGLQALGQVFQHVAARHVVYMDSFEDARAERLSWVVSAEGE
ncbi:hypothetical protein EJ02DRAFT_100531 [Clathrospora elynae]|uniref:Uncharacterized protein n=1 Tax=Clathrospora elynae TaxID=706981 RepID=A0A6A5SX49_9PLEO|nr:hypothetical protein EJ02DRAFT_100531 [Clathrospora elynae]